MLQVKKRIAKSPLQLRDVAMTSFEDLMVFCRTDDRSLSRDITLDERPEKGRNSTHIDTKVESSYLQCTCRKVIRAVRSPRGALGVLASFVGLFTSKGGRTVDNVMENCICVEQVVT